MKAQNGELELWIHSFSSSALYDVKWSASRPDRFTLGKEDRFILNRKLEGGGALQPAWTISCPCCGPQPRNTRAVTVVLRLASTGLPATLLFASSKVEVNSSVFWVITQRDVV